MPYRNSLRFRIFAIFMGGGLLLGPLLALVFLTAANELEELAIARGLAGQLRKVMAAPEATDFVTPPGAQHLRIFGDMAAYGDVPLGLEGQTGIYELDWGGEPSYEGPLPSPMASTSDSAKKSWRLAAYSQGATTFVVGVDQTILEHRESLVAWVVVAGTLLSVLASLGFGYQISKRLIRPIQQLAAATSSADGMGATGLNPEDYPPDEIGQLASALRRHSDGMTEALSREKAFSAEVAHELRNPLAVIQSAMEIIEKDASLPAPSARALHRAIIAAHEMSDTLGALLLLGRGHAPSYPAVDMAAILMPVVERNTAQATIPIDWRQISGPEIRAPEAAVRMIADNLVRNAVQNTPSGHVEVTLMADRLIVRDTGIGILPSELEAVRQNGTRGSNALGAGSGLGLALVDRLCNTFGWSVDIQSPVDEGTIVTWRFG